MPSPFPGMDPYLEVPAFWEDFHDGFITYWRDAINDRLPEGYEARINERVTVVDEGADHAKVIVPDVAVLGATSRVPAPQPGGGAVATLEPITLPLVFVEEVRTTYIEIRRIEDRRVVTILELLSPSNKSGNDRQIYLTKRNTLLREEIHLFELDLLLGGQRVPLEGRLPPGDYYAFLSRADRRFDCDVYAWSLRRPLPILPIPLQVPDPDLMLDFQELFTTAYDRGRYARSLAYDRVPPPLQAHAERAWAEVTAATIAYPPGR